MMFEIEIESWHDGGKFTPDQQAALRNACVNEITFKDDGSLDWGCRPITDAEGLKVLPPGANPKILRVIDNATTKRLRDVVQRDTTVINERCHVAVGGLGLLLINEVKAELDFCSDALQRELAAGWKILAICVQPDQRRPDYVLGRTRTDEDE